MPCHLGLYYTVCFVPFSDASLSEPESTHSIVRRLLLVCNGGRPSLSLPSSLSLSLSLGRSAAAPRLRALRSSPPSACWPVQRPCCTFSDSPLAALDVLAHSLTGMSVEANSGGLRPCRVCQASPAADSSACIDKS